MVIECSEILLCLGLCQVSQWLLQQRTMKLSRVEYRWSYECKGEKKFVFEYTDIYYMQHMIEVQEMAMLIINCNAFYKKLEF
jgi:hypothetical protein